MALKTKVIKVPVAADEFGEALLKFIGVVQREVKDNGGWNTADDAPAIALAAVTDLLPSLKKIGDIRNDFNDHRRESLDSLALLGPKIYDLLAAE